MTKVYMGVAILALFGAYTWGIMQWSRSKCIADSALQVVKVNKESKINADAVRKIEQSLGDNELNSALCALGIMRQRQGCK